jgi:hypothetical protein
MSHLGLIGSSLAPARNNFENLDAFGVKCSIETADGEAASFRKTLQQTQLIMGDVARDCAREAGPKLILEKTQTISMDFWCSDR